MQYPTNQGIYLSHQLKYYIYQFRMMEKDIDDLDKFGCHYDFYPIQSDSGSTSGNLKRRVENRP
jgi:hypothetical protein